MPIRTLIVDDHVLIREGLRRALSRADGIEVVAEAASIAEARACLTRHETDVIVLDLGLPDGTGLDLCREQRADRPGIGIVILTMYVDDKHLLAARDAGASRFIGKGAPSHDVIEAVRNAFDAPQPLVADALQEAEERSAGDAAPGLTDREAEVLGLLAEGLNVAGISRRLFISESTTKTHVGKIYTKLGASNRAQALMTALRFGLVEAPGGPALTDYRPSG